MTSPSNGVAPAAASEGFGEAIGEVFLPEERIDLATAIGGVHHGSAPT